MRSCVALLVLVVFATVFSPVSAASKAPATSAVKAIKGVVVDRNGKPIPRATVFYMAYKEGDKEPTYHEFRADAKGRFSYTPKAKSPSDVHGIYALADKYSLATSHWQGDRDELKLVLSPEYKLKGRVVDENGKPLEAMTVKVINAQGNSSSGGSVSMINFKDYLTAKTAKNGSFAIGHLVDPSDFQWFSMSIEAGGKGRATIRKHLQAENLAEVDNLVVPRACVLEGTLTLPDGSGPAPEGTQLVIRADPKWGGHPRYATVGKSGKFRTADLPPGKASLVLGQRSPTRAPDGKLIPPDPWPWALPAVTDLEISPDKPLKLDIALTPGALVEGLVKNKNDGKLAEGARLSVNHSGQPQGVGDDYVYADSEGKFKVRVAAGDVVVRLRSLANTWYPDEQAPKIEFSVADGAVKADVAIEATPREDAYDYQAESKPIPPDFLLRAGTYELKWDPEFDCSHAARSPMARRDEEAKAKIKKTPEFASTNAGVFCCKFDAMGDGLLAVALDESKGDGKGFDTAYVDTNRNWDLTDDKPVSVPSLEQNREATTDWLAVQARHGPADGEHMDRTVQARLQVYYGGGPTLYVSVQRKGAWVGTVRSTKGVVQCVLPDSNCDGVFGDVWKWKDDCSPEHYGDDIYIDTNGLGKVTARSWSKHCLRMNPLTKIGGRFYGISVSDNGGKVKIEPYTGPMGYVTVRVKDVGGLDGSAGTVYLSSKMGDYSFERLQIRAAALPVGDYKVGHCQLTLRSGNARELQMAGQTGSQVSVKPGEHSTVDISGKLSLAINPDVKDLAWTVGKTEQLTWVIKIGDKVTLSSIGEQGTTAAPRVKFFDDKGKMLAMTTAGYT